MAFEYDDEGNPSADTVRLVDDIAKLAEGGAKSDRVSDMFEFLCTHEREPVLRLVIIQLRSKEGHAWYKHFTENVFRENRFDEVIEDLVPTFLLHDTDQWIEYITYLNAPPLRFGQLKTERRWHKTAGHSIKLMQKVFDFVLASRVDDERAQRLVSLLSLLITEGAVTNLENALRTYEPKNDAFDYTPTPLQVLQDLLKRLRIPFTRREVR